MAQPELTIPFAENSIRIIFDDPAMCEAFAPHMRHLTHAGGPLAASYTVTTSPDGGYALSRNDDTTWQAETQDGLFLLMMMYAVTSLNTDCLSGLLFHSACVAAGDQGVLICHGSGTGKSTLAAWMVADGFDYLTDEVALSSGDDYSLTGLTRSVVLKSGSRFVIDRWVSGDTGSGQYDFADGSCWIDPELLRPGSVRQSALPRLLIAPRYDPASTLTADPMTSGQTTFHLMQHLVNARNFHDHGMRAAADLARRVKGYTLTYPDCAEAAAWIRQTLAAQ